MLVSKFGMKVHMFSESAYVVHCMFSVAIIMYCYTKMRSRGVAFWFMINLCIIDTPVAVEIFVILEMIS